MLLVLLLWALLLAGSYGLGVLGTRLSAAAARPTALAAALLLTCGATATAGWLSWPSYLTPFHAALSAAGSLAGGAHGLLHRTRGRHT